MGLRARPRPRAGAVTQDRPLERLVPWCAPCSLQARESAKRLTATAAFPITAFSLGTWQIQRLRWKTDLLARHEDALARPPAILPDRVDADLSRAEEYRRVLVRGTFRHDQEMLLGPRVRDGVNGYFVITPMERPGGDKILVNRGWIPKARGDQKSRPEGLPTGEVIVEGLLRAPWKKNYFTPENRPDKGEFYFSDVAQMAALAGAKPVWIEETMRMHAHLERRC
jgi:surfeit locus 1 family protein